MKFTSLTKVVISVAVALTFGPASAAVSADEAKQLGTTLTLTGAEVKGNADGTIPAYTGGLSQVPAGLTIANNVRPDPFASDKPRLTITKANMAQYEAMLTEGEKELLKRLDGFTMNVYPTRRSASFPKVIQENSLKNATGAKSIDDGLNVEGALPGTPFPIPKTGFEVMWNHLLRYTSSGFKFKYDAYNVDRNGNVSLSSSGEVTQEWPIYQPNNLNKVIKGSDTYYQIKSLYSAPTRRAGEGLIVKDAVDPLNSKRRAWQYLPGQRRVKEAPDVAYDTPNPVTAGVATYDDAFTFNGAMDRYDFKLIGKKEMIVPYNVYSWVNTKKEDNFMQPGYPNPAMMRWELHRVWVVEATLKEGKRHIYAKRRFYVDEDTWFAVCSESYDARGQIYRTAYHSMTQAYDQPAPYIVGQWNHDFSSGSYSVSGVNLASYQGVNFHGMLKTNEWSPEVLAGSGIR